MENIDNTPATPESVWALLREIAERQKNADIQIEKSRVDFEKSRIEFEKSCVEYDKRFKNLHEMYGGMSNSNGLFAEEYFFNSFENKKQTFFGEKFDAIRKNVPSVVAGIDDEYDILMLNGNAAGIIEVKYKARLEDIPKIINKANTFRISFPQYKNHRIYLGLAAMIFNKRLEDECIQQGIAIVKQVGETVVINDNHLKVF